MENLQEFKQKHINLNKFLFLFNEKVIPGTSFFGRASLRSGALTMSILSLFLGTGIALSCLEYYSFLFFLGFFLPSVGTMAGSVISMLSIEHMEERKAYWGYIATAISIWLYAALIVLTSIMTLLYSPGMFFRALIWNLFFVVGMFFIYLYTAWVDFCYAKHLGTGNFELVLSGKGEGLISNDNRPADIENNNQNDVSQ